MVKLRQLISLLSLSLILGVCALAQTNLTQIRDTVTNSDGSPFNGTVVITFTGYTGSSNSTSISPLSTSARIYNGILSVLLVPSTTAGSGSFYQAAYHSNDGLTTWTETWSVPVSSSAVTLSAVRTSSNGGTSTGSGGSGSGGSNTTTYATLPIAISDVTGLASQLSSLTSSYTNLSGSLTTNTSNVSALQSTVSGLSATVTSNNSTLTALNSTVSGLNSSVSSNSGSLTSLTSVVNGLVPTVNSNNGSITSLTSTVNGMSSTVSANNSALLGLNTTVSALSTTVTNLQNSVASLGSSTGSSSGQTISFSFVDSETPGGTIDGSNTGFTLANAPSPLGSLELYRNGLAQTAGVDYTISGKNITFLSGSIPVPTDVLQAFYRMSGSSSVVTFVDSELPTGTKDGSNLTFNLVFAPSPAIGLKLYKNGMMLRQGGDYTLSGSTVTFVAAATPRTNDSLTAFYRH